MSAATCSTRCHPRVGEIAYFDVLSTVPHPGTSSSSYGAQGSYAMSQLACDGAREQIIYSDGNSGLYTVPLENVPWQGACA